MANNITQVFYKKINFFKNIIQNTYIYVQKNKRLGILSINEFNLCVDKLHEINNLIHNINELINFKNEDIIERLQLVNDELSSVLKLYGTEYLEELLIICFGSNNNIIKNDIDYEKFDLLKRYFHPIGYKIIQNKNKKNVDYELDDENLSCSDILNIYKEFYVKVNGIKILVYLNKTDKILIYGILDDIIINNLDNNYIKEKIKNINKYLPNDILFQTEIFKNYISGLTIKDLLINSHNDIYNKFIGLNSQLNDIKQKHISHVAKHFISDDLFNKRNTLIVLLTNEKQPENLYLAYLLYDLLSNDQNGNMDTRDQTEIYDSLPIHIKKHFKYAIKETIEYTNELTKFDNNKIAIEQQICLLKTNESVKEKAMAKLKEVKAKSEDSGSKARQYLDGLLKIPFGIFKKERILSIMDIIKREFKELCSKYYNKILIEIKENYTNIDIIQQLIKFENYIQQHDLELFEKINDYIIKGNKHVLLQNIKIIDNILIKKGIEPIWIYSKNINTINKSILINYLKEQMKLYRDNSDIFNEIVLTYKDNIKYCNSDNNINNIALKCEINNIKQKFNEINQYMIDIRNQLDKSVYGQQKAKQQIERIIAQWINGKQNGYCFGFEGAPGIGKTSLAKKGLSQCLLDENGKPRPFSMIQMGGDSNGSSIHGHNYTYVGSTWGSIVQILIDTNCMNPIIFIDEVDKISKTEHGKEIVSILTHLLDPTQNDCFQDKYFMGIDLDLSKALFILSYNDAEAIDKILLDRIHRVKFDNLSIDDKIVICNQHLLPDIYSKMGLDNILQFKEDTLKFIIDEYTAESGVRKLKEILFEIIGEINLSVLKNNNIFFNHQIPIEITINDIKEKYFKDKYSIKHKTIHKEGKIGTINGLWANVLGRGGIIPIQVNWRPSGQFLSLHLTGMQGEIMKESMNVALTLAWELTSTEMRQTFINNDIYNKCGIHVHCPEGATPKDGPSAGTAITIAIYSLLNNKKIKNNIAITGEICLNGNVTEIGGLELKILGAIKAGVKSILFPNENMKDYNNIVEKYNKSTILDNIFFKPINTIYDAINMVFEDE